MRSPSMVLATRAKRSRSGVKKLVAFLTLGLVPIFAVVYLTVAIYGANSFTSSPNRSLGADTPAKYGLTYENVSFKSAATDRLTLRAWWLPNPISKRVLIAVHGKDTNRGEMLELSSKLWANGYNLLLFDMRGHGQSDGDHYSFGQYEQFDIVGAVNFVESKGFEPAHIGIVGHSMGSASALMAMSQTSDIKAGIIDSSYADFDELAQEKFSPTTRLPGFFFPGIKLAGQMFLNIDLNQAKPEEAIKKLGQRHVFLIHGDEDSLIPLSHFYRLKTAGGISVGESWVIAGAEHVQGFQVQPTEYVQRVVAFLDRELK
jgi:uncharacterized protein